MINGVFVRHVSQTRTARHRHRNYIPMTIESESTNRSSFVILRTIPVLSYTLHVSLWR